MKKILTILFITIVTDSVSQTVYRSEAIQVTANGNELTNPWAGGINDAQISKIDLNLDGKEDLFIFDRISNRISTYINTSGQEGEISYDHDYGYVSAFPDSLEDWVLLRDYNCDGKKDIFTNHTSGTRIYENIGTPETGLHFILRSSLVYASYDFSGDPFSAPLYTIGIDIPSIVDFDEDGDMDVFAFTELSSTVYYYKNLAVEIGQCDSLAYICANRCYGMFNESIESFDIAMGDEFECDFNVIEPRSTSEETRHGEQPLRHTGGMLLSIDLDQNGIKDLILSDVTFEYMTSLQMEDALDDLDSATVAHFDFPATFQNTVAAQMHMFPAGFYEDIDNDGIKDLTVSPNAFSEAEDMQSVWYYKNNGLNDLPDFDFVQIDFMQETMIDLGSGAYPVLFDENADGLLDLVVANDEYFLLDSDYTSQIWLFRNTGTATQPAFELVDDNWLDIPSHEWKSAYPAFGDLDNDGDQDLVMGNREGFLNYFVNTAGAGNPAVFQLQDAPMHDANTIEMDIGIRATPQLIDMTNDGLLDLVVGERNGNINLYENIGTAEEWNFEMLEDSIGDVIATNVLGINGNCVPFFYRNENNELQLLMGSETGQVNQYTDIEGNFLGDFTPVTMDFSNVREGANSAIQYADVNGDGLRDLFYGNKCGGLAFYDGLETIGISELVQDNSFFLYPNPGGDELNVFMNSIPIAIGIKLRVLDVQGRIVMSGIVQPGKNTFNTSTLAGGVYLVEIPGAGVRKWVKSN